MEAGDETLVCPPSCERSGSCPFSPSRCNLPLDTHFPIPEVHLCQTYVSVVVGRPADTPLY